jgi:hypothetical protein
MLRSILRAIVVVVSGGYGIGGVGLSLLIFSYLVDGRPAGEPWGQLAALGVGAFVVGIGLLGFAWRMLYPPGPQPPTGEAETNQRQAVRNPGAVVIILALAALIAVAIWGLRI